MMKTGQHNTGKAARQKQGGPTEAGAAGQKQDSTTEAKQQDTSQAA